MREAQNEYSWKLNFGRDCPNLEGEAASFAAFLQKITEAFERNSELPNLLLDEYFKECISTYQGNWREVVSLAVNSNPLPYFLFCIGVL